MTQIFLGHLTALFWRGVHGGELALKTKPSIIMFCFQLLHSKNWIGNESKKGLATKRDSKEPGKNLMKVNV